MKSITLRGSAKYELRLYSEALDDFTDAIDLNLMSQITTLSRSGKVRNRAIW